MEWFNVVSEQFIAIYDWFGRYAVTGPDSSRDLSCQHTQVAYHR